MRSSTVRSVEILWHHHTGTVADRIATCCRDSYTASAIPEGAPSLAWPATCTAQRSSSRQEDFITNREINPAKEKRMTDEQIIRNAYQVAERKDIRGWIRLHRGRDLHRRVARYTYRGKSSARPSKPMPEAFPDMHRELHAFSVGDTVIVQLSLQGTQKARSNCPRAPSRRQATGWTRPAATYSPHERQDPALRLLPVGDGHWHGAAWRARQSPGGDKPVERGMHVDHAPSGTPARRHNDARDARRARSPIRRWDSVPRYEPSSRR